MKTCYNCGNNANPTTVRGKRNVDRLRESAFEHYHPLAHFGFCVKRRRWLDDPRRDCANWTDPCRFDASRVHIHLPLSAARIASRIHAHRYHLALVALSAVCVMGLALTAYVNGYS